tara:strand:- start:563 stop:1612 length:1050 start_codon:yes stop_codon:yes gene_type:complete
MSLKNLSVKIKIPKILKKKLNNKKINQIFKKFEGSLVLDKSYAVAVSGGPDSLALAFLAKIYSIKKNLTARFFIVDHKLRKESTIEAKRVKQILKNYSIKAEILTWHGKKPSKNIQSEARKKRYNLLFERCRKLKINHILLGHHSDDLLENFFIRMIRGSGLKGLISLDTKSKVNNINLLRPLLNQKKENLVFLSKYVFNFYVDDPSNEDEKYQRVRIRNLIKEFQKDGFDKSKLLITIRNLKYSNEVVTFYVADNIKRNTHYFKKENKLILNNNFFNHSHEVVFRALGESLKKVGKRYYLARGKKLDKIISYIKNDSFFKITLGGCIIERVNQSVIITKEHKNVTSYG